MHFRIFSNVSYRTSRTRTSLTSQYLPKASSDPDTFSKYFPPTTQSIHASSSSANADDLPDKTPAKSTISLTETRTSFKFLHAKQNPGRPIAEKLILLYQYRKNHLDEFQQRWCTKPIKGHDLTWNGKLGVVRVHPEGGLGTYKTCRQSWLTVNICRNPARETLTCTRTSTAIDE